MPLCLKVPPQSQEHSQEMCNQSHPGFAQRETPEVPPCPQERDTAVFLHHCPPGLSDLHMREYGAQYKAAGVCWGTECPTLHCRHHPGTQIYGVLCALKRQCGGWCFQEPHQTSPSHYRMSPLIHCRLRGWHCIFSQAAADSQRMCQ